jgi:hypothetical protein
MRWPLAGYNPPQPIMMADAFSPVSLFEEGGQESKGEQARMVSGNPWHDPTRTRSAHLRIADCILPRISGIHCRRIGCC